MSEIVQYVLSLKDELSAGLDRADQSADRLHGTMGTLQKAAIGFGVGLAAIGLSSFLSGAVDMYADAAQAGAQLDAAMLSTANVANLNRKALDEQSEALMKKSLVDDDAITSSQALLATFTQVKDKIFMDAIPAIVDMSQALKMDLQGATTMVGKALNDPIKGINALSRAGVSFTESQKETIKQMVETNQTAEAQAMILKELQTEYGGSALAASQVGKGPMIVLQNEFNNVKERAGELIMKLVVGLKPALTAIMHGFEWLVDKMQVAYDWVQKNKELLTDLGIVVGVTAGALGVLTLVNNTYAIGLALVNGMTTIATAAQWAWNAALTANPIGVVIVAIGGLAAAVVACWDKFVGFRAVVKGVWGVLKEWAAVVSDIFGGIWKQIKGVFTLDGDMIAEGFAQSARAMYDAGSRMAKAYREGYDGEIARSDADEKDRQAAEAQKKKEEKKAYGPSPTAASVAKASKVSTSRPAVLSNATGSKSVTFNIHINDLVKSINFNVTNIKESAGRIKEVVGNALLQTVNDFQQAIPE